jgi:hypothetical protein
MSDKKISKENEKKLIEEAERLCKDLFESKELNDNFKELESIQKKLQQIRTLKDGNKIKKIKDDLNLKLRDFIEISEKNMIALVKYFQKLIAKKQLEIKENEKNNLKSLLKIEQINQFNDSIFNSSENNLLYIYFSVLTNSKEYLNFPNYILFILIFIPFSKEVILYIKDEKSVNLDFQNVDYILNNYDKENSFLNLDLIDALIGTEIKLNSIMAHEDIEQSLDMEKIIKSLKEKEILKDLKVKKITKQEDLKKAFEKLISDNKINCIKTNNSNFFNFLYLTNK